MDIQVVVSSVKLRGVAEAGSGQWSPRAGCSCRGQQGEREGPGQPQHSQVWAQRVCEQRSEEQGVSKMGEHPF